MRPVTSPCSTAQHGNPTVALPPYHAGGRLVVHRRSDTRPLWVSHGIPASQTSCTLSVWSGNFLDEAAGWSVLPAGEYPTTWRPSDGGPEIPLLAVNVACGRLFDDGFDGGGDDPAGWELRPSPGGSPEGWAAFRWAAMHGTLTAAFEAAGPADVPFTCGLLGRYYNRFHHLRVTCQRAATGRCYLRLWRVASDPPDTNKGTILAEQAVDDAPPRGPFTISWTFNGDRHVVSLNRQQRLAAREGYMGGVEIVGAFTSGPAVRCTRAAMESTQHVIRHTVEHDDYVASIRPGNIDRIYLKRSDAPGQNICWDSGVQFGHIGGSEIKFTQGASLRVLDEGPVATAVAWDGPMPRMVEQAYDVRGHARGIATFYPDRIVVADDVLVQTNRSVGPDIDLLGRLMAGPARVAVAGASAFADWTLPADGTFHVLQRAVPTLFPLVAAFPMQLGTGPRCWLTSLIHLRAPIDDPPTRTAAFAWQCPSGLTASHDFRCTPTIPGTEYRFTIVMGWHSGGDLTVVEQELLRQREQWVRPVAIEPIFGSVPACGSTLKDAPAETGDIDGCFDRRTGRYVVSAGSDGRVVLKLDPLGIPRQGMTFAIDGLPSNIGRVVCRLDRSSLSAATGDFTVQQAARGDQLWLRLQRSIDGPVTLEVRAHQRQEVFE